MSSPETEAVLHILIGIRSIQGSVPKSPVPSAQQPMQSEREARTAISQLLTLLNGDWLVSVAGYFINHRNESPYAELDDEYKVQDLIYCLALSLIPDLQYEDPQRKNVGALSSTRVDFSSVSSRLFIEVKLADSVHSAKKIEAEIHEDIGKYGRQTRFDTLIFFVYCNDYAFPSPREFERGLTGPVTIHGHTFMTYCIVKP